MGTEVDVMKKWEIQRRAARAACATGVMLLALAGCRSAPPAMHVTREVTPETAVTRQALEARLLANIGAVDTFLADVNGRLVIQGLPVGTEKPTPLMERKLRTVARPAYPGEWSAVLTTTRLLARRKAGEEPRTRFVTEFLTERLAFSLLSIGDRFWIRVPKPAAPVVTGVINDDKPRSSGWPTMRPQDLGVLLFYDDLRPEAGEWKYITCMETWPDYYILHVLHPGRAPEIIYSRIWVERQTLNVVYHQLFDADGTVVAEARLGTYTELSATSKSKGESYPKGNEPAEERTMVSLPTEAIVFWPKENLALELRFTHIVLNQPIEDQFFAPPDATKARIVDAETR